MRSTIRRKRPTDLAPEASWDSVLADFAALTGWTAFHVPDSRRMRAGLPDWILIRGGRVLGDTGTGGGRIVEPTRVVFLETKVPGGRLRPAQEEVVAVLERCPGVEVYVLVFPDDWPRCREILR